MADNQIDLGSKVESIPEMASPSPNGKRKEPKVSYPSLYAHKTGGEADGFDKLPEGDFHFQGHGKVISRTHEIRKDEKGSEKHHHRVELEVHHIIPHSTKGEKTGGEGEPSDPGEGLKKELESISKKKDKPSKKDNEVVD